MEIILDKLLIVQYINTVILEVINMTTDVMDNYKEAFQELKVYAVKNKRKTYAVLKEAIEEYLKKHNK